VDGELFLSDDAKFDCRRDILSQVTDELTDAGLSTDAVHITFHLTSIYDHSIFDVMSRVVQRLIVNYATMEDLLNMLVSTCSMEKAFLFDVVSKLYISTDAGPVDIQSVELCSDMIDVVMDVSGIYSVRTDADNVKDKHGGGGDSSVQDDVVDAYDEDSASVIQLSSGLVRRCPHCVCSLFRR
jgi:Ras-related GTP-binding protein C/D